MSSLAFIPLIKRVTVANYVYIVHGYMCDINTGGNIANPKIMNIRKNLM